MNLPATWISPRPDIRRERRLPVLRACALPFHLRSPASSTPDTMPASKALPSSINSSTLSESASSALDKPCRSPDAGPSLVPIVSRENARLTPRRPFLPVCLIHDNAASSLQSACFSALLLRCGFLRGGLLLCQFLGGSPASPRPHFPGRSFLRCHAFFLLFFLAAIGAV